jgi:class 3 adenylate cyclase
VNTAARLCKDAEAGEILVGAAFRNAVRRQDLFEPAIEMSLRGKSAAVEVWRVRS